MNTDTTLQPSTAPQLRKWLKLLAQEKALSAQRAALEQSGAVIPFDTQVFFSDAFIDPFEPPRVRAGQTSNDLCRPHFVMVHATGQFASGVKSHAARPIENVIENTWPQEWARHLCHVRDLIDDLNSGESALSAEINASSIKISVGTRTAALLCMGAWTWPKNWAIADIQAFAKSLVSELLLEDENGTTLIHELLDNAAQTALENGKDGFEQTDDLEAAFNTMRATTGDAS